MVWEKNTHAHQIEQSHYYFAKKTIANYVHWASYLCRWHMNAGRIRYILYLDCTKYHKADLKHKLNLAPFLSYHLKRWRRIKVVNNAKFFWKVFKCLTPKFGVIILYEWLNSTWLLGFVLRKTQNGDTIRCLESYFPIHFQIDLK